MRAGSFAAVDGGLLAGFTIASRTVIGDVEHDGLADELLLDQVEGGSDSCAGVGVLARHRSTGWSLLEFVQFESQPVNKEPTAWDAVNVSGVLVIAATLSVEQSIGRN